jgi:hypothetical protein
MIAIINKIWEISTKPKVGILSPGIESRRNMARAKTPDWHLRTSAPIIHDMIHLTYRTVFAVVSFPTASDTQWLQVGDYAAGNAVHTGPLVPSSHSDCPHPQ